MSPPISFSHTTCFVTASHRQQKSLGPYQSESFSSCGVPEEFYITYRLKLSVPLGFLFCTRLCKMYYIFRVNREIRKPNFSHPAWSNDTKLQETKALKRRIVPVRDTKAYGGEVELELHPFLTLALDGSEWIFPWHSHFTPRRRVPDASQLWITGGAFTFYRRGWHGEQWQVPRSDTRSGRWSAKRNLVLSN